MAVAPCGGGRLRSLSMDEVVICRSADGETVAEVDLDETSLSLSEMLDAARAANAALVWAYSANQPTPDFTESSGYTVLRTEGIAGTHAPLPRVDADVYGPLLAEAYRGQWGHKWVEQPQPLPLDGSIVLALTVEVGNVGLCRVWPESRRADAPGLVRSHGSPDRSVRLLHGASTLLGPGAWEVECWGEDPETLRAYQDHLGLTITHQLRGWELRLHVGTR
jgi:hypothetical protein